MQNKYLWELGSVPCISNLTDNNMQFVSSFTFFYKHITYQLLNLLKIKRDINQQDLKLADLHFVKSEQFSVTWSCGVTWSHGSNIHGFYIYIFVQLYQ